MKRSAAIFGDITHERVVKPLETILKLWMEEPNEEIILLINSGGGSLNPSFMFADMITALAIPLTTIGSGAVCSMAIPIFVSGKKRLVTKHTNFFFHELGSTPDKDERLPLEEVEKMAKSLRNSQEWYAEIVSGSSGGKLTKEKVLGLMRDGRYIYPDEAKKLGLVDDII